MSFPSWRVIVQGYILELHRGDSRVPYRTWEHTKENAEWAAKLVDILNIVQECILHD